MGQNTHTLKLRPLFLRSIYIFFFVNGHLSKFIQVAVFENGPSVRAALVNRPIQFEKAESF